MRGFILGIILTLVVLLGGAYYYATRGYFDTRAVPNRPSTFEHQTANHSVDAWVDGHAPKQANPFQPTMENVMDGSMVYDKNCATCHGSLKQPTSALRDKFYPPVPQLMSRTPDDGAVSEPAFCASAASPGANVAAQNKTIASVAAVLCIELSLTSFFNKLNRICGEDKSTQRALA